MGLLGSLRYHLAQMRTRSPFNYKGLSIKVFPDIVNPTCFRASFQFADAALHFAPQQSARVLELGCGCGLTALALAKQGHQVVALDIDIQAVFNTIKNANRNKLHAVCVKQSDWDNVLPEKQVFDYIVCNPPFLTKKPGNFSRAFYAGSELSILRGACAAMHRRLAPGGRGLLFTSSQTGRDRVLDILQQVDLVSVSVKRYRDWNEIYFADVLSRKEDSSEGDFL